jgi:hypothetical protein
MTPEMLDRLNPFRAEALNRGIPAADAARWIEAAARPCATLSPDGDGPVVGHFGAPLMLPPDAPDPYYPLLASIDLAALPKETTDLPLPFDGRLLLFAFANDAYEMGGGGEAVYIPAGVEVEERAENHGSTDFSEQEDQEWVQEILEQYPRGELHLTIDVSLPSYSHSGVPDYFWHTLVRQYPHAEELGRLWHEIRREIGVGTGRLQLGGYPADEYGGGGFHRKSPEGEENRDWVLLADWRTEITGVENLTVHWPIRWPDMAAWRFDQATATVFWNP